MSQKYLKYEHLKIETIVHIKTVSLSKRKIFLKKS